LVEHRTQFKFAGKAGRLVSRLLSQYNIFSLQARWVGCKKIIVAIYAQQTGRQARLVSLVKNRNNNSQLAGKAGGWYLVILATLYSTKQAVQVSLQAGYYCTTIRQARGSAGKLVICYYRILNRLSLKAKGG